MEKSVIVLATWYVNHSFVNLCVNTASDVTFYSVKKRNGITLDFGSKRAAFCYANS